MSTIRLFLDEDVWPGLATLLRERGFDVVHAYEVERGGMSDADQLAYSAQEGRTILTHNVKDFVPLAGELVRRTLDLLRSLSAEKIANTVRHLADYR
jgi:predicted nuclease of predicted toxin-antitoxin system